MPQDLLAVTGATGRLGRLALAALRDRVPADRLVAVVRDPARAADLGVALRHGDYDKPDSLRTAFAGASRLLFISSPVLDPGRRTAQHLAVVAAARDAGVGALAYTSFHDIPPLFGAHQATEEALAASGIPHTILRNPFYSEPFAEAGLVHATGGRPLDTATRADLAEAAAIALLGEHTGRVRTLTGPLWTYPELDPAAVAGEVPGPMGMLHGLARAGLLATQTPDLAELLGREPVTMATLRAAHR